MNTILSRVTALLLCIASFAAVAAIDAPDHIIYGNVTVFGAPAPFGTVIELRAHPSGNVLASYELGSDVGLGSQFALRIPMDTVDPRRAGFARPGDPVRIFVGTQLAADTSVGAEGVTRRLDLDPQSQGTGPSVAIADRSQFEGNGATSVINFTVQLNTTSPDTVQVEWETEDGTASGGPACGANVDYVIDDGVVNITAGGLQGTLPVLVCGDTTVEADETFTVNLTRVVNGVPARTAITGTLLDDDDVPIITVEAARVAEPPSGAAPMQFIARLSRSSAVEVRFDYATQNIDATAGADYAATSGAASFAPGSVQTVVSVSVMSDATVEPPERVRLLLSNPVQGLLTQADAIGTIEDPAFDPVIRHEDDEIGGPATIPTLLQPSDIEISADGAHAYVASESGDAVLQFTRAADGDLTFVRTYTTASAGFATALLDAARDIELSADGNFLYVAAQGSNGLTVLSRTAATGDLAFVQTQADLQVDPNANGGTVRGLLGTSALALSPDGAHLYATGSLGNSLAVFARDAATGQLRFLEAEVEAANDASDAGGAVEALVRPAGVLVSGDGNNVYVAARFGNALLTFARDPAAASANYGRVSFAGAHRDGQLGIEGLAGAYALVLSADDKHLYVASESDNAVVLFDRGAGGALVRRQQWTKGGAGQPGLGGAQAIALSNDGTELYVAGFADHSLTVFARANADAVGVTAGALTPRQTVFDGDVDVPSMAGPTALAMSPDGLHVYVAANIDNAIVRFGRLEALGDLFGDGFE